MNAKFCIKITPKPIPNQKQKHPQETPIKIVLNLIHDRLFRMPRE